MAPESLLTQGKEDRGTMCSSCKVLLTPEYQFPVPMQSKRPQTGVNQEAVDRSTAVPGAALWLSRDGVHFLYPEDVSVPA